MRFIGHPVLFTTLHASLSQSHFETSICNTEETRVRIFIVMNMKIHGIMAVWLKLCDFIRPQKLEVFESNKNKQKHLLHFFYEQIYFPELQYGTEKAACDCPVAEDSTVPWGWPATLADLRGWVTSVEIWAVFTQRPTINWPGIPLWHKEDCGLQAQLEEMVWAKSPEILRQMLNSFVMGVKGHQSIRTFGYKTRKSTEITNGFQWELQEHAEEQFKWKKCCPGDCDCVTCVDTVLKFCGNPREKFWFMWLNRCSTDTPLFDYPVPYFPATAPTGLEITLHLVIPSELLDMKRDEEKRTEFPCLGKSANVMDF